ncbi:crotonase/enoyl-CoA hydratase family protein [Aliikangiella marina]|uniref:Crotonase/enoyl-CoA hydratase family protein n=1 Tax=Aliikangiella marina TaxID=1712262 RepID=A0A545TD18_9GAMM|nr:crotonase/enoyl-CoA hydratase family protein [Aliikangiella marina]TQV75110.1 crotonase/enoyl-CoA hydratase family protein [Aliikangiella marina]
MQNIDNRIVINVENKIATVSFSRPDKHNALDMPMFYAIDKTVRILKKRKDVRVIIVNGEGQSFCSGLDIKSVMTNKGNAIKLLWKWLPGNANLAQRVTVGWRRLRVPVIMAIHGKCWGGGMQIALGGDYRIAAADASLSIMEARWGLIPDMGGTIALSENMPVDQAMKLAMTAETLSAEEALNLKLISQVAEDPYQAAKNFAESLVERSPDVLGTIKPVYHSLWCPSERKILARETLNQWRIIFGKNRAIAVKKAMGKDKIDFV